MPQAQVVGDEEMVAFIAALNDHIAHNGLIISDAKLASRSLSASQQLNQCAQDRERKAAAALASISTQPTTGAVTAPLITVHRSRQQATAAPAPTASCWCECVTRCCDFDSY